MRSGLIALDCLAPAVSVGQTASIPMPPSIWTADDKAQIEHGMAYDSDVLRPQLVKQGRMDLVPTGTPFVIGIKWWTPLYQRCETDWRAIAKAHNIMLVPLSPPPGVTT